MKNIKSLFWPLVLMVVIASLYRVIPRPAGFAPQLALALFAGAIVKDKKWAFVLPVISMFISDLLYQGLYAAGLTNMQGFYGGQWLNYLLIASVTIFGFFIKKETITNVFVMSLIAPTYFFLVSNFLTWVGVGDYVEYSKTWQGLMDCYTLALPFYKMSIFATLTFSAILFGSYVLITRKRGSLAKA